MITDREEPQCESVKLISPVSYQQGKLHVRFCEGQ